ncbi:hypothetical protein TNCT_724091 [Trichonephila clavata]|uniref:Uncharacterized protein n=1 Tax=Trichonephila clavata TaxID=2740835 RepID=A0A8X6LIT3_TRICU|nr:hypothetical protein TNCT_724091 [Trichonephila clavata]
MIRIQSYKLTIVEDLKKYPDYEEDHFYQNALMELQDIENSMQLAVSPIKTNSKRKDSEEFQLPRKNTK